MQRTTSEAGTGAFYAKAPREAKFGVLDITLIKKKVPRTHGS